MLAAAHFAGLGSGCLPGWADAIDAARAFEKSRNLSSFRVAGCSVSDETRTVPCEPEAMRRAVEIELRRLGLYPASKTLSLETYSLARNLASEAGHGLAAELIGIGETALNRARAARQPLVRQMLKDGRRYARQSGTNPAVATSQDPAWSHLVAAELVLAGRTDDYVRGAIQYFAPMYYSTSKALSLYDTRVGNWGHDTTGLAWIGPRPGIDPRRQFFMRPVAKSDPTWRTMAPVGRAVIARRTGDPGCIGGGEDGIGATPVLLGGLVVVASAFFFLSATGRLPRLGRFS